MDRNAILAVKLLEEEIAQNGLTAATAWKAFAKLFLSCNIFEGKRTGWQPLHDVVVYRESNDFKIGVSGPNTVVQRAEGLSQYLAGELGINRKNLCSEIGQFWRHPQIVSLQPHNLVGNAFRSSLRKALQLFGDPGLTVEEEVGPRDEFPGYTFSSRSKDPRIDVLVRRGHLPVALISVRWRFRHDRVDVLDEAMSYVPAARRLNPKARFYAFVGEFNPARLDKILSNCPPAMPSGAIDACVHFAPQLLWNGLKENGRTSNLNSLEWLIQESFNW
jgi:hypothetical protein